LSILLSTLGRPTTNSLRVIADHGTGTADLFHGYAIIERGTVSRARKITHPFVRSALIAANAVANGARRGLTAETAFPGLRELVRLFYDSIRSGTPPPIAAETTLDTAAARDRIIAAIELSS
ncbi:MAG TPA: hypothetical protein VHM24_02530, partial [Gemmatimonadaceae bacterium]|nr:hypothetical protein [Gemmatimonadaceae bacterium]